MSKKNRNNIIKTPPEFGINTKLFLLLGNPVSHSFSPRLHNTGFQALGLNMIYLALTIEPNQLANAVKGIRALNIGGANITIPFKESIIPFLDDLEPIAKKIGAVNTLVNVKDTFVGYNTDVTGFLETLQAHQFNLEEKRVLLLGAGGAARAIAWALIERIDSLIIANRTSRRAIDLQNSLVESGNVLWTPWSKVVEACKKSDLIVNSTSVGLANNPSFNFLSKLSPPKSALIFDLVYSKEETPLVRYMCKKGIKAIDGKEMLVRQALAAFELWIGQKPSKKLFFSALSEYNST